MFSLSKPFTVQSIEVEGIGRFIWSLFYAGSVHAGWAGCPCPYHLPSGCWPPSQHLFGLLPLWPWGLLWVSLGLQQLSTHRTWVKRLVISNQIHCPVNFFSEELVVQFDKISISGPSWIFAWRGSSSHWRHSPEVLGQLYWASCVSMVW